jgi:5-methylcytosine-specific restriction enzyme subunit McrC
LSVPIRNILYLLAYAWDLAKEGADTALWAQEVDVPEDLFAMVLASGLRRLIARGLDRGYLREDGEIAGVRGRIDLAQTLKSGARLRGRLWCNYDELSFDVAHNQIIRGTIHRLIRGQSVQASHRGELVRLDGYLQAVARKPINDASFRRLQLHSNNRTYRLLVSVCELLYRKLLPDPDGSGYRFVAFTSDELDNLFESFLRKFYAREQATYPNVSKSHIYWQDVDGSSGSLSLLPRMETDISLKSDTHSLIVEAKFYSAPFVTRRESEIEKLRSGHLYQLYAYLRNASLVEGRLVDGLLVYASPDGEITEDFTLQGHRIRVATVDLTAAIPALRDRLLRLVAA